jgi:hypothetical protein
MKNRCRARRCCLGIGLDDGVHGIVVWDSLYALFVLTTTLSVLVRQVEVGKISQSFTDLITALLLSIRAAVGMNTCCHNFQMIKVRNYFLVRLGWDFALIIFNIIMMALRKMPM